MTGSKGFLDQILKPIDSDCFHRILDAIGHEDKVSIVLLGLTDCVFFEAVGFASDWSLFDHKVLLIQLFIRRIRGSVAQIVLQSIKHRIKAGLVIRVLLIVDILLAVEASVHHKFDLIELQEINRFWLFAPLNYTGTLV